MPTKNRGWSSPFGFRPGPVSFLAVIAYTILLGLAVYVHHSVPEPADVPPSVDLDQAWHHLQTLTES